MGLDMFRRSYCQYFIVFIKVFLFCLLFIVFSYTAYAFTVEDISIVSYGRYRARTDSNVEVPFSTTGSLALVTDLKLIEETKVIKSGLGTRFGVKFKLIGSPSGKKVPVKVFVRHPPFRNSKTKEVSCLDQWDMYPRLGQIVYAGWEFTQSWELIPGLWSIHIACQEKVWKGQQFIIEMAEPEPIFLLQTGAFKNLENALGFQGKLQKKAFPARRVLYADPEKGPLHLVYIAVAKTRAEAKKIEHQYSKKTNNDLYIHKLSSNVLSKSLKH